MSGCRESLFYYRVYKGGHGGSDIRLGKVPGDMVEDLLLRTLPPHLLLLVTQAALLFSYVLPPREALASHDFKGPLLQDFSCDPRGCNTQRICFYAKAYNFSGLGCVGGWGVLTRQQDGSFVVSLRARHMERRSLHTNWWESHRVTRGVFVRPHKHKTEKKAGCYAY